MLERALIPGGRFLMGATGRRDDEEPIHSVDVDVFEMALTPVTNEAYRHYLDVTGREPPRWFDEPSFRAPDQPVVGVNWDEARAYCEWLSATSGLMLRLPTEAEREKATRGGAERLVFPWGNDAAGGGHSRTDGPLDGPERVASTSANGYGVFNLADTVHEWCLDAYRPDFYKDSPAANPCAFGTARRAARGGSWRHQVVVTPCAGRSSLPPAFHYADFGFRWVRVLT